MEARGKGLPVLLTHPPPLLTHSHLPPINLFLSLPPLVSMEARGKGLPVFFGDINRPEGNKNKNNHIRSF